MTQLKEKIQCFRKWIENSDNIVFFGGAGVSTESGIPDFRSVDGLYHQHYKYPPETILSHSFFLSNPEEFYRFYRDKLAVGGVKPNITHKKLAELEEKGKLKGVITQNIDGLHQLAGSKKVLELHGSIYRNHCMHCNKSYHFNDVIKMSGIPRCMDCDGIIKPDVVLYEESLDQGVMMESMRLISEAEVLVVGGTSLSVYPAAGMISYYSGEKLVLINRDSTSYDSSADLVLNCSLGAVFSEIN